MVNVNEFSLFFQVHENTLFPSLSKSISILGTLNMAILSMTETKSGPPQRGLEWVVGRRNFHGKKKILHR